MMTAMYVICYCMAESSTGPDATLAYVRQAAAWYQQCGALTQAVCLEAITAKSLPAAKTALLRLHEQLVKGGRWWSVVPLVPESRL